MLLSFSHGVIVHIIQIHTYVFLPELEYYRMVTKWAFAAPKLNDLQRCCRLTWCPQTGIRLHIIHRMVGSLVGYDKQ